MRTEYEPEALTRSSLADDPYAQFTCWFDEACGAKLLEPNAFSLATANAEAVPALRTVLLKYYDADGFVFFTNYESAKARDIEANPQVCMLFPWLALHRQVIIKGRAEKISKKDSLSYFLKRPRDSQMGAWVSQQSSVISSRSVLESKLSEIKNRFKKGDISLPPFWGGYRICPKSFEFWQGGKSRLHDRFLYQPAEDGNWSIDRLSP